MTHERMSCVIAFVTDVTRYDLTEDDRILSAELERRGFKVVPAIWTDPETPWNDFDIILFRSCWDYYLRLPEFFAFLQKLQLLHILVLNPLPLLHWNLDKLYLRELEYVGVDIVPTRFIQKGEKANLRELVIAQGWDDVVLKPTISAGSHLTWRISASQTHDFQVSLDHILKQSSAMIQPFISEIQTHGEWSLIYFFGEYSHTIIKRPKAGDFRVQSEFGGSVLKEEPSRSLKQFADGVISKLQAEGWAYARVDVVRSEQKYYLSELELLEPSLYFKQDPGAAPRFANGLQKLFDTKFN